jgi:hypothetical protein
MVSKVSTRKTLYQALGLFLSLAMLTAGCAGPAPTGTPSTTTAATSSPELPTLGVSNGTTIDVSIVVNGQTIGHSRPG